MTEPATFQVTWFAPNRPVDGGTVYVRPEPERQHAVLIRKTRADLESERDELLARVDGCDDPECPHHGADLDELDTVQWLLDGCD